MYIAVIDDGINEKLYSMGSLKFNIEILPDLTIIKRKDYDPFLPGHGTSCAAIIKKYAEDALIGSIKILNDKSKRGVRHQLIKALQWCTDNGVKLINLSLGTIDFRDFTEIKNCVDYVTGRGLIIIAACNNKNVYTVPACLTNVIGVKCKRLFTDNQYIFYPYSFSGIDIAAGGRHFLTDVFGNGRYTDPSNSFAAPLITAMVYRIMKRNPVITLEDVKKELYKESRNFESSQYDPYVYMSADRHAAGKESVNVWDPALYKEFLLKCLPEKPDEIEIPVILVYEPGNTDVFHNLSALFEKDGYYTIKVSSDYTDVHRSSEYLPDDVDADKFMSAVYKKYDCDVILIRTNNISYIEYIEQSVEIDIKLFAADINNVYLHVKVSDSNKYESIMIENSGNSIENQIEGIYSRILKLFEIQ